MAGVAGHFHFVAVAAQYWDIPREDSYDNIRPSESFDAHF